MKAPVKIMRRKVSDWEKIFENNISDKKLGSKIYLKISKLNSKK